MVLNSVSCYGRYSTSAHPVFKNRKSKIENNYPNKFDFYIISFSAYLKKIWPSSLNVNFLRKAKYEWKQIAIRIYKNKSKSKGALFHETLNYSKK